MARKSRLYRQREKGNKKTIILSIVGIVLVLSLLFKYGPAVLINFSLFLGGRNDSFSTDSKKDINYVPPPIINSLPQGTKEEKIKISGTSQKDSIVILYIDGRERNRKEVDSNGDFDFEQTLSKGSNEIKAKAIYKDKESEYSNIYSVYYNDTPPKLEVSEPTDGANFKKEDKSVRVTGSTDGGVGVTVNGFYAVIDNNNNFSYVLPLNDGDNEIKIIATDVAGNISEKIIKVSYSP